MREDRVRRGCWLVSPPTKRKPLRLGLFFGITWRWACGFKEPRRVQDAYIAHYKWLGLIPLNVTFCGGKAVWVRRVK